MKASFHQYNLDHALGHNIPGVLDSTNRYCIFSFLDKRWRKNVAVDIRSCKPVHDGYVKPGSYSWRNMRTWVPQKKAYRVEKLTGCVSSNNQKKWKISSETYIFLKKKNWKRSSFFSIIVL